MKKNILYIVMMVFLLVTGCDEALERYRFDVHSAEALYTNATEIRVG